MSTSGSKHTSMYRGNHIHTIDKNHIITYIDTSNNYTTRAHIHTGTYNSLTQTYAITCSHINSYIHTHMHIITP